MLATALLLRSVPLPSMLLAEAWAVRLHRRDAGIPYGMACGRRTARLSADVLVCLPRRLRPASRVNPPRRDRSTREQDSDVIFRNVRVLAIGQLIEARDGKKLAEGNTATLELTPAQARHLAWANVVGEISLAVRSIAEIDSSRDLATHDRRTTSIKVLRFGKSQRAYGVN